MVKETALPASGTVRMSEGRLHEVHVGKMMNMMT